MEKTNIMGQAQATAAQMQAYIREVNPDIPQSVIAMLPLYLSEGAVEGVRGDIAFAQSCLETGNFTFSGSAVTLDQNNFAGIGVTQNGLKGCSWATPQLGIRAQIQHLKAYASSSQLCKECVDPRYAYVKKGCAPYVEWLGIQENPQGAGWAAGANYGGKILNILEKIIHTESGEKEMSISILKKLIGINQTPLRRSTADIQYIVVHYVGALGGARENVDYYQAYSWHCGGGLQGSGGASHYGKCTNQNSIGIEMCVKKRSTATMNATDKDWYFTEQTYQATVQLVRHLMAELGIDADHVIRHYDVNGKICPNPFVYNTGAHTWAEFKKAITDTGGDYMFGMKTVQKGETGNHVLLVQEILRARGFKGKNSQELALDRECGTQTVYAIKQYQKEREKVEPGIVGAIDGIAGPKTLQDMIAL